MSSPIPSRPAAAAAAVAATADVAAVEAAALDHGAVAVKAHAPVAASSDGSAERAKENGCVEFHRPPPPRRPPPPPPPPPQQQTNSCPRPNAAPSSPRPAWTASTSRPNASTSTTSVAANNLVPPPNYGTVFTSAKAGMDGVDFEHVKRVVYEASANSLHGAHQQRRDAALALRVEALRARALSLVEAQPSRVAAAERVADALAARLLAARDRGRSWVCLDMDAFFYSVEARDDSSGRLLRSDGTPKPFAVGSASMIATANAEARRYGVRSAMPGFVALKLCPHLQFVKPRFDAYVAASKEVMAVLPEFDPRFEAMGLDEAFVDVTEYVARKRNRSDPASNADPSSSRSPSPSSNFNSSSPSAPALFSALDAANEIRARVRQATSLPSSAGVAPNKMLAKIASDLGKPDGAFAVPRDPAAIAAFVAALPVRKVPGVGRVTERILEGALDVSTCSQLFARRGLVFCLFGKATAEFLLAASVGVGSDEHGRAAAAAAAVGDEDGGGGGGGSEHQRKGLSAERTFAPTDDVAFLESKLAEIASRVSEGASAEGLRPRTLTLKVKYATFDVVTRSASVGGGVGSSGGHNSSESATAAVAATTATAAAACSVSSLCSGISSFADVKRVAAVATALFRAECLGKGGAGGGGAAGGGSSRGNNNNNGGASSPPPSDRRKRCGHPVRLLGIRLSNWLSDSSCSAPLEKGQRRLDDVLAAFSKGGSGGGGGGGGGGGDDEEGGNDDGDDDDDDEAAPLVPQAAAAAAALPCTTGPTSSSSPPSSSTSPFWTCALCTFSGTRHFSLRCDVCGAPRGSDGRGLLAERAVADQRAVAEGRGLGGGGSEGMKRPEKQQRQQQQQQQQQQQHQAKRARAGVALDAFFLKKR